MSQLPPEVEKATQLTRVDRILAAVAPRYAIKRIRARAAMAYYDGATRGRRGSGIRRSLADPNVMTARDLASLRAGARDLERNNPHAARLLQVVKSNVVGGVGMRPSFIRNGTRVPELEALSAQHLRTTQCDARGRHTYAGLQALGTHTIGRDGEVLIRRRFRRSADPIAVPLQFEVLEPDYLDASKDGPTESGGQMIQGVEFDRLGRIRGYWLFGEHPGGPRLGFQSKLVPAREIAHGFEEIRPGQARGVSWLAPVMLRLADFSDYEQAHLVRQKLAAMWVGFWHEAYDSDFPDENLKLDPDEKLVDELEPGLFERVPPGTEVKFHSPPGVEGYAEYSNVSLHAIAAGFGVSYESLTGDLRGVNFSSGKMGRLEMDRNIERWQSDILLAQICDPMMKWWLEACALKGVNVDDVEVRHTPPSRAMIDPTREGKADIEELLAGTKTFTQLITARGRDPREHAEEYRDDVEMLAELGLDHLLSASSPAAPGDGTAAAIRDLQDTLEAGAT